MLKRGVKKIIMGIGPIVSEAIKASELLEKKQFKLAVASLGSIKPLDNQLLEEIVREDYTHWISLEEHHKAGGLGSCLLEWLSEKEITKVKLTRMGIDDTFIHKLGDQGYVREQAKLTSREIAKYVERIWTD